MRMAATFYARLRGSDFHEPRAECADYFMPQHFLSKDPSLALQLFEHVASAWPHYNRTVRAGLARHVLFLGGDHGPGDAFFARPIIAHADVHAAAGPRARNARLTALRASPADPARVWLYLVLNGVADDKTDARTGDRRCNTCFVRDLDIRLPTPPDMHPCGPFCGGLKRRGAEGVSRALQTLRAHSPWALPAGSAEREAALRRARPVKFWWAGAVRHARATHGVRNLLELHHAGRANWSVTNTLAPHAQPPPIAAALASADFCGSPLGWDDGDLDRYLPALLYGCVPVFFHAREARPLDELLEWDRFSLVVEPDDIARLPQVLAAFDAAAMVRMRRAIGEAWERLLYSSYARMRDDRPLAMRLYDSYARQQRAAAALSCARRWDDAHAALPGRSDSEN
jgi:hypothetical protein